MLSLSQQEKGEVRRKCSKRGTKEREEKSSRKLIKTACISFILALTVTFTSYRGRAGEAGEQTGRGGPERGLQALALSLQHTTPGSRCDEITGAGRPVLEQEGSDGSASVKSVCRVKRFGKRKKGRQCSDNLKHYK